MRAILERATFGRFVCFHFRRATHNHVLPPVVNFHAAADVGHGIVRAVEVFLETMPVSLGQLRPLIPASTSLRQRADVGHRLHGAEGWQAGDDGVETAQPKVRETEHLRVKGDVVDNQQPGVLREQFKGADSEGEWDAVLLAHLLRDSVDVGEGRRNLPPVGADEEVNFPNHPAVGGG